MNWKRPLFFFILILSMLAINPSILNADQKIRVGFYNFAPLVFIEQGEAKGFFVDILNHVATKENWKLEYIFGSWNECLTRLKDGDIDLLVSIADSRERSEYLDFTNQFLFVDWGIVFTPKKSHIESVMDLKGKTIGVLKESIYTEGFKRLVDQFGIDCKLIEKSEYEQIFQELNDGKLEAGINALVSGIRIQSNYNIERTNIYFSPVKIRFAARKNTLSAVLSTLDTNIADLKSHKESAYYELYDKWMGLQRERIIFPKWLLWTLGISILCFLTFLSLSVILRKMVKEKTLSLLAATEQIKKNEQLLRESLDRLAESNQLMDAVLKHTHMMVVFLDSMFNFIWVNKAYADTCGYEPSFFPGNNHFELYPNEENQAIFQRVVDTGESFFVMAKPFVFPDQPERGVTYWDWSLIPVKDNIGKVTGLVFTLAEVSKRIRAEEALRESEEKYRKVVDNANEGIVVTQDGMLKFVNRKAVEISGYSQEELTSKPFIENVHPDDRQTLIQHYLNRLKGEEVPSVYVFRSIGKDGDVKWIENNGVIITWEGKPATLNLLNDITDRKAAEEKIMAALSEKETMLKEIHHRVKNNLQVISSLLNIQSSYLQDDKAREALFESMARVKTMAMIHSQLYQSQDLARIDCGGLVRDLAGNISQSYGVSPVEINVDAGEIRLDIDASIPCGLILNELVSNSLKHAFPEGRVGKIDIRMRPVDGQLVLTVSDNGIGFPETVDLEKTKSLGLELVNILVKQMNGSIEMRVDGGTTWAVTFPVRIKREWRNG